jgi:hypothetical protein
VVYTDVYFLGATGAMGILLLVTSILWLQHLHLRRRKGRRGRTTA